MRSRRSEQALHALHFMLWSFEHQHAATTFPDIKSKGLCGRGPPVPAEIGQWRPPYKFTESLGEADEGQVKVPVLTGARLLSKCIGTYWDLKEQNLARREY